MYRTGKFTRSLLLLSCSCLLFCTQPSGEAKAFNDQLVTITEITYTKANAIGQVIGESLIKREYNRLPPLIREAKELLVQNIEKLNAIRMVRGGEKFKQAVMDLLLFEQRILTQVMDPLNAASGQLNDDSIQSVMKQLFELGPIEQQKLSQLQAIQKEFADRFGLRVAASQT